MTGISKETFKDAEKNTQMLVLFDLMQENNSLLVEHIKKQDENCSGRASECDKRFKKLESGRKVDLTVSATTGFIGGIVGIFAKGLFK